MEPCLLVLKESTKTPGMISIMIYKVNQRDEMIVEKEDCLEKRSHFSKYGILIVVEGR